MNLQFCLSLAEASYDTPYVNIDNTGLYYAFNNDKLYISISGTNDSSDVLADLSIFPNFKGAHYGFARKAKAIKPKIMEIIAMYTASHLNTSTTMEVVFVGHSLGGAIAQILSREIKNTSVVSFGSPKVWLKWCSVKINHIRVYHNSDPVPKLLPLLYRHFGTGVAVGFDGFDIDKHKIDSYKDVV